jgi:hypothetical protein
MGVFHDVVPSLRGQCAAGHILHRRGVIITIPNGANVIAGVANEPGIRVTICRPGLACNLRIVEMCAPPGSGLDHLHHHRNHGDDCIMIDDLLERWRVAVVELDN